MDDHCRNSQNHAKNLLIVDVKRTARDAANTEMQDSDVLNCVNAVVDAQISIKTILPRWVFLLISSITALIFF